MKHTPGNWVVSGYNINTSHGEICVAQVSNSSIHFDDNPEEVSANAKLIASAPDMFRALVDFIDEMEDQNINNPVFNYGLQCCLYNARKAIAKTGT